MKTSAYEVHPLWKSLDNLRSAYENAPSTSDPEQQHKIRTVGAFIAHLDQYREDDGLLVHENYANQVNQQVANMAQHMQSLAT